MLGYISYTNIYQNIIIIEYTRFDYSDGFYGYDLWLRDILFNLLTLYEALSQV